jgi:phosphoglycolate phosphatase
MRHSNYPLVIFDWDGTLMDSTAVIARAIQAAAGDLGFPVPDLATASHVIGLGLQDALALAVPALPQSEYRRMADRYRFHFLKEDPHTPLFPGVESMLAELVERGHVLAVATGKSSAGLARALQATRTVHFFAATRCADQAAPKPAPDMLNELMDEFGVSRESTVMIGDTTHDLRMAGYAGVGSVAVTYGAHPREELDALGPLACLDSVPELVEWLRTNA